MASDYAIHILGATREQLIEECLRLSGEVSALKQPIHMILTCPCCMTRHIDESEFATKPHSTHACQGCGMVWRPAKVDTVGVLFLPGYKNP